MKKYSLLFLFLLAFLNSCQDATEIDPKDVLVDELAIENTGDLELAVRGIYAVMSPQSQIYFTSLVTDEVIVGNTSNGAGLSTHRYNITPTDAAASAIWVGQYAVINRVNRILELADANIVVEDEEDQIVLDNLKGECYAIRALAHFELFSYYSPSYTNDADLSVPYIDYVVIFQKPGRNTVGEVAEGINADIALADDLLSDTFVKNRMSKLGLTALKAKFNLFRGNYDAAIAAVNELDGVFTLSDPGTYFDMFQVNSTEDNDESIFELTRASAADAAIGRIFINNTPGSTNFNMSNSLFNQLTESDVRFNVNVDDRSTIPTDIQIGKYRGAANLVYVNNFKYFRLSDMFLIRAEANLRKASPNLTAAQGDLQAIATARDISGTPPVVTVGSVADGLTKVLAARRIELAFEASRFTDLKRFGVGVDRTAGGTDCDGTLTPCILPSTDYRFTLPIPEAELLANPTIRPQQNTGY